MFTSQLPHLARGTSLNKGGVGEVFKDPRDPLRCIKRFFVPKIGDEAAQLARLIQSSEWARPSERHIFQSRFSWPTEGFGTPDRIVGYSMPLAPKDAYFELTTAGRTKTMLLQLKYLMNAGYWTAAAVQSQRPEVSRQDRLVIAIELLDAMETIHQAGFVYGDVSSNNMCARLGKYPSVFLLDADSIVTPDVRRANPVRTPGWEVPDHLDPLAADRSLIALFIWRFLLEDPRARPGHAQRHQLAHVGGATLGGPLVAAYETGAPDALADLTEAMRGERDDERDAAAILRAAETGYARLILREAREARSPHEKALVDEARQQILFEERLESSPPPRQRLLLSRREVSDSPLSLDLAPHIVYGTPPSDVAGLRDLMFDARFAETAIHFTQHGLGHLEQDSLLPRSMAHALVEAGKAGFAVALRPDHATVSWSWPPGRYVNVLALEILINGVSRLQQEIQRKPGARRSERALRLQGGGKVQVKARLGIGSPSGVRFFEDQVSEYQFEVPAAPPAPRPVRSSRGSGALNQLADLALVDEVEEARLAAAATARAYAQRRARILASAAAILVAALSGGTTWYFAGSGGDASLPCGLSNEGLRLCTYASSGQISRGDLFRLDLHR